MSGVTPLATNPTSGLGAYTCGKRLVSGSVWLVIAVLNNKKSSGTVATGSVPLSDEIPTAVEDAGDRIGDNRFHSAEVLAIGGQVITSNTAGGAITASTYSGAHNALSTSLTGVVIIRSDTTSMNILCSSLSINAGISARAGSSSSQSVPGSTRGATPNSGHIDLSNSPPPPE